MPRIYKRNCDYCGKEYKGEGIKFCGRVCGRKGQKKVGYKKGMIPWNKGTKGVMRPNSTSFKAGDKYWLGKKRPPETVKKMVENRRHYKATEETRRKQSEALRGEKCYLWKGGITPEHTRIRTSMQYREWRKAVFMKDYYTCQKTGIRGGNLVAHHIKNFSDYPELRFSVENGITLSVEEHKNFHIEYGTKNNSKDQVLEFLGTGDPPTASTTTEGALFIKYTA
jgi:hypothetical protein